MNGPKIYFTIPLFGGIPITQTTVSSFAVMLLLCIAGIVLGSNLQKRPSRRQVLVEKRCYYVVRHGRRHHGQA